MRQILLAIWETIEVALIALAVVLVVRTFLIQPFFVEGLSMAPNFNNGDYLIVDELTYRFREPQRGEIIVFRAPNAEGNYYIKRILGLPQETVKIEDGKITIVNSNYPEGFVLQEPYLQNMKTPGNLEIKLGEGQYIVLGDNRYFSYDSRNWGLLPRNNIVGLVRLRIWPLTAVQAFTLPQYNY